MVEAAKRSGSLITARLALEQDREVFAVPGSPLDPRAEGGNSLIQQGARLITGAADIIEALSVADPSRGAILEPDWTPDARRSDDEPPVRERPRAGALALSVTPVPVDDLIAQTGLSVAAMQTILLELDLAGQLEWASGQLVALRADAIPRPGGRRLTVNGAVTMLRLLQHPLPEGICMKLVIVESPAKAKTINKYLGSDYEVVASYGHVRDLPAKDGSVRPEEDFAMSWEVDPKASKRLSDIARSLKDADELILATDPDREGEAISWHVLDILRQKKALKDQPVSRVVFNAITKDAVTQAMKNPRQIDGPLVDAYLARRALDYLVGFTLSPVLWRKLPGSRSAGRVQSVALRIVCDREAEIEKFKAVEYWSVARAAPRRRARASRPASTRSMARSPTSSTSRTATKPRR